MESFIKAAGQQGKALKVLGTALLIDCENEKIASMVADAKETTGLCLRAGDNWWSGLGTKKNFGTLFASSGSA